MSGDTIAFIMFIMFTIILPILLGILAGKKTRGKF